MKWLVLAVVCAALMVKGQESKPHSDAYKGKPAPQGEDAPGAAGQTVIVVNQQAPQRQEDEHTGQAKHSFRELLLPQNLPNVALVVVGIAGIVIAVFTLKAIGNQVAQMRRQVDLTFGQLRAMHEQITEMSAQTDVLERSVKAAQDSANAAQLSADAFVLSERAWIQVTISKPLLVDTADLATIKRAWAEPDIMNIGRTPAKITKIVVFPYLTPQPLGPSSEMPPPLPPEPGYSGPRGIGVERDVILAPNNGINPVRIEIDGQDALEVVKRELTLYVYGFVDYFDVVGRPHQTRFCWLYWPRLLGDPTPESFIVAGNTPASFTRCT